MLVRKIRKKGSVSGDSSHSKYGEDPKDGSNQVAKTSGGGYWEGKRPLQAGSERLKVAQAEIRWEENTDRGEELLVRKNGAS